MATAEVKAEQPELVKEKCTTDPNFAVVCAFIERFGTICGVLCPSIGRLQVNILTKIILIGNYALFSWIYYS